MKIIYAIVLVLACWCLPVITSAKGITTEQADQILKELKEIRLLLEKQNQPPPPAQPAAPARERTGSVPLAGKFSQGNPDAALVMVEFSDYECPFCKRFHTSTYKQLKETHIDTGQLLFVSVDLPLGFHKNAMHAAHAARCADAEGKYWELRDVMIDNAKSLSRADIDGYAKALGLNVDKLNACIDSGKHQAGIDADIADAGKIGVTGTPSFVIGIKEGDAVNGQIVVGAKPTEYFVNLINQLSEARQVKTEQPPAQRFQLEHIALVALEENQTNE